MMRSLAIASVLVSGPTLATADERATAADKSSITERARLELQPAGRAFTRIAIDNPLGDVIVEGYDGPSLQIETKKTAPDDEGLERLRISLVPNPDGTVRIATTADRLPEARPLARSAVRIDLKVRAPHNVHVEATSSAGKLVVSNMDNGSDLETASGPIQITNVSGELSTHSVNGATSIQQVFSGTIDSHALDADLMFDSIAGERLYASADHGKISGRRVRSRDVQLTTYDGMISLEAEASLHGRMVLATIKGNVDVRLRRGNHPTVVRARGNQVNLGGVAQTTQPGGWVEARLGTIADKARPMMMEMRSRHGKVQVVLVD